MFMAKPQDTAREGDAISLSDTYGVAPLLSPLFDFTPNTNAMGSLQHGSTIGATASPRPLSASSSYSSLGAPSGNYIPMGPARHP